MFEKDYPPNAKLITPKELHFDPIENSKLSKYIAANPVGDWVGMSAVLRLLTEKFSDKKLKILEVGTAHGHFVYSMRNYLIAQGREVDAYGMDSGLHGYDPRYFNEPGMTYLKGNSTDPTFTNTIANDFHFVFIDSCHCANHAFQDATTFHVKLRSGGFLGFHDTHPKFQGGSEQPFTPECSQDRHIGVVKGIERFKPEEKNLQFLLEEQPLDKDFGGLRFYEKV